MEEKLEGFRLLGSFSMSDEGKTQRSDFELLYDTRVVKVYKLFSILKLLPI